MLYVSFYIIIMIKLNNGLFDGCFELFDNFEAKLPSISEPVRPSEGDA